VRPFRWTRRLLPVEVPQRQPWRLIAKLTDPADTATDNVPPRRHAIFFRLRTRLGTLLNSAGGRRLPCSELRIQLQYAAIAALALRTSHSSLTGHRYDKIWFYVDHQRVGGGVTRSGASCQCTPDYGDAGIYREGHRASSKAMPCRDATSVPTSSEQLICRCRGQVGPESDGRLRRAHTIAEGKRPPWQPPAGDGPAMPSCSGTHQRASIGFRKG
jgi:hypothetical protein